ncbi:MAG: DUF2141 domain-containing protein [Hyphomonadaceae bacterium]|nr:DUF2141 domain-containing protein [Hyphomonadaceae bacterium]
MIRSAIHLSAIVALTLVSTCTSEADAESDTATLSVTLTGIETLTGTIRLGLYAGEEDYTSGPGIGGANVTVEDETMSVTLEGLAPGAYGIKLYHDVNGNGEMDTNPFGMPTEPFAFSNNAPGRFGPAKWDAASFEIVAGENAQTITVGD